MRCARHGVWLLCHAVILTAALAAYRCCGPRLVTRLYEACTPVRLQPITEPAPAPLTAWLVAADAWALRIFLLGVLLVAVQAALPYLRTACRHRKAVVTRPARDVPFRRKAAFAVVLALLAAGAYGARYRHLRSQLLDYDLITGADYQELLFPKLEPAQVMMLGGGHGLANPLRSSYLEVPRAKRPGVTRIGLFGCSFVQGAEAAGDHNPAFLLQRCFEEAGNKDVEVINFHTAGMGMAQMILMWDCLGRDYDLDHVVLLPFRWHRWRDCSFIYPYNAYGPVHARYILKGDDVELIPVAGRTRREACGIYHRLLPPLRYVRYDRNLPLFLRTVLPSALHNRANPFYYRNPWRAPDREVLEIYGRLLTRLAAAARNVIVVANDDDIYSLRGAVAAPNVYFLHSQAEACMPSFLYFAPKSHPSAMGNDLRARELFSLLTGRPGPVLDVVRLSPDYVAPANGSPVRRPLHAADSIEVAAGGRPVAALVGGRSKPYYAGRGEVAELAGTRVVSLLGLPAAAATGDFLCLPTWLEDNAAIAVSFKLDGAEVRAPLGVVRASSPVAGMWAAAPLHDGHVGRGGGTWRLSLTGNTYHLWARGRLTDISVTAGGAVREVGRSGVAAAGRILSGWVLGRAAVTDQLFDTVSPHSVYLRAQAGQYLDAAAAAGQSGTLDLVVRDREGRAQRHPLAGYSVERAGTVPFDPPYTNGVIGHAREP